jgi:hypothetical protein
MVAKLQSLEIDVQRLRSLLVGPLGSVPRRHDEILVRGRTPVALPARQFRACEDPGEGGVDRQTPGNLGLSVLEREAAEGLERAIVMPPAERGGLAAPEACQDTFRA